MFLHNLTMRTQRLIIIDVDRFLDIDDDPGALFTDEPSGSPVSRP